MAEEVLTGVPVDVSGEKPPEIVVEVEPEKEALKPTLSDEEVERLAESPAEDEVQRYAKDAQRRIKSLHTASQEWRKRVIRANNDLAAATNLAHQLYEDNKNLRQARQQSEAALVEQAIQRADAQLAQARQNLRTARMAQDIDAETKASEEMARYVAEGDRLRLLKPSASGTDGEQPPAAAPAASAPGAQPQARPPVVVSQATQGWVAKNPWFNDPKEARMRNYAMAVHAELVGKGITEQTDPEGYFGTIDQEMRKVFPERFKTAEAPERSAGGRPVAVVGATRAAAPANGNGRSPRHVTLSESQLRIARSLDLTPEQYALQLVKEGKVQ